MLMILLRFSHVFFGAIWVGMMAFQVFFLAPSLSELGPDAGKLALISGFWLFARLSGGNTGALMQTRMGMAFGLGGAVALLAFLIGIFVMRPAMMKSMQLAQSRDPGVSAEVQRLQGRATTLGRVVTVMLLFTLAAMAVARYL
jgi:hypothetical protein